MKRHQMKNYIAFVAFVAIVATLVNRVHVASKPKSSKEALVEQYTYLPGNTANGIRGLRKVYELIGKYRVRKQGSYPDEMSDLLENILQSHESLIAYGFRDNLDLGNKLSNPDSLYSDNPTDRRAPKVVIPYVIYGRRPDGSEIGSPKFAGTQDLLSYADLYVHFQERAKNSRQVYNPRGYYLALWNDGQVEKIPFDRSFNVVRSGTFYDASFFGQAGLPLNIVTYEEHEQFARNGLLLIGKPLTEGKLIPDNGAPESLVTLSRLLNFSDRNGIAREELWKTFYPSKETFTLKQTQEGAQKLKLPLTQKKLTLAQLAALRSPAVLQMRGDIIAQNLLNPRSANAKATPALLPPSTNRIVTLAQSDIEYSIVQDAGSTRIVKTAELAKLYGGEALLPQAASAPSALQIDNPVRVVSFASKSDEAKQVVKLTNVGKTPLTLEIERPIPGVTKAELSSKTLASGESATLTLTIKWREVLPGDVQQVFVTLKTNDAVQPRAMLGFRLQAPPTPVNAAPAPNATPPALP